MSRRSNVSPEQFVVAWENAKGNVATFCKVTGLSEVAALARYNQYANPTKEGKVPLPLCPPIKGARKSKINAGNLTRLILQIRDEQKNTTDGGLPPTMQEVVKVLVEN